jgi:hypothetical protein
LPVEILKQLELKMNTDPNYFQKELLSEIQFLKAAIVEIKKSRDDNDMWDNSDMIRNWKVSLRTLADWRAEGKIGYVQVGSKIWYPKNERELFLKTNLVKAVN